jgi:hypothetical protein
MRNIKFSQSILLLLLLFIVSCSTTPFIYKKDSFGFSKYKLRVCVQGGTYVKEEFIQAKHNTKRIIETGDPELYIVAVQQAKSENILVNITQPRNTPFVLALTSQDFVSWIVTIDDKVVLDTIVVYSYVDTASNVTVISQKSDSSIITDTIPFVTYCLNEYNCDKIATDTGGYRWEDNGEKITTEIAKDLGVSYSVYVGSPVAYMFLFQPQFAPCKWLESPEGYSKQGFLALPSNIQFVLCSIGLLVLLALFGVIVVYIQCPQVIKNI